MTSYLLRQLFRILEILLIAHFAVSGFAQDRLRDYGIFTGIFKPGTLNAITDVAGVKVGHTSIIEGDSVCTGVTAILPHDGNIFQEKVPAAIYIGNGFGKLAGYSQVEELGNIETPIILTNTLNVATAVTATIRYTLDQVGNEKVRSVNAVVGETNDGRLNDIRGMHIRETNVLAAIRDADSGRVKEGSVGAGTGTIAFGYKGGIGTSSRQLPMSLGGYTLGVLVQANFGGVLQISGAPVGVWLDNYPYKNQIENADGSCMIIVATDAPLDARNLKRLAKRAMLGLARTGGYASNGSGDYVIAFSTYTKNFDPYISKPAVLARDQLRNDDMLPLFLAVVESTEEAILNALFTAKIPTGFRKKGVQEFPVDKVVKMLRDRGVLKQK